MRAAGLTSYFINDHCFSADKTLVRMIEGDIEDTVTLFCAMQYDIMETPGVKIPCFHINLCWMVGQNSFPVMRRAHALIVAVSTGI